MRLFFSFLWLFLCVALTSCAASSAHVPASASPNTAVLQAENASPPIARQAASTANSPGVYDAGSARSLLDAAPAQNTEFGITVTPPANWEVEVSQGSDKVVANFKHRGSQSQIEVIGTKLISADVAETFFTSFHKELTESNFEHLKQAEATVGGNKGKQTHYKFNHSGVSLAVVVFEFTRANTAWLVMGYMQDAEKDAYLKDFFSVVEGLNQAENASPPIARQAASTANSPGSESSPQCTWVGDHYAQDSTIVAGAYHCSLDISASFMAQNLCVRHPEYVRSDGREVLPHFQCPTINGQAPTYTTPTSSPGSGPVKVRGYYRKDGTYVRPHTRSRPSRRR